MNRTTQFHRMLCVVMAIGLSGGAALASTVSLGIDSGGVRPGVPFYLNVQVDQGTDVYAALFDLVYDGAFLELVDTNPALSGVQPSLELGPLLAPGGSPTPLSAAGRDDVDAGRAVLAVCRQSVPAGVTFSQPAQLLRVQMVAKMTGATHVDFSAHDLRDSNNMSIAGTLWVGLDIVSTSGDNNPPSAPVVAINPSQPMTNQNLVCSIVTPSTDLDGDNVTYTYAWFRDSAATGINVNTVPAANTMALEVWLCRVTPTDGKDNGPAGVASTTVGYIGDVNRDFKLDRQDLLELSFSWNRQAPDALLNPLADLNLDGHCDAADATLLWDEFTSGPTP